jgi:hypothetical protein
MQLELRKGDPEARILQSVPNCTAHVLYERVGQTTQKILE